MKVLKLLMGLTFPAKNRAFASESLVQELTTIEIQQVAGGARVSSQWDPRNPSNRPPGGLNDQRPPLPGTTQPPSICHWLFGCC